MSRMRLRKRRQRSRAAASSKKFRLVMSCIETWRGTASCFRIVRAPCRLEPLPGRRARALHMSPAHGGCSKRLLDDGPVVIASIASLSKQPDPAVRIVVEFGRQHPFLEQRLLFRRAIGIDLNKSLPRCQALDFTERRDQFVSFEIMDRIERNDGIEAAVRERQFGGISKVKPADDLRLAMHERVFRDLEAERFQTGTGLQKVFDQEPLGAADVEDAVTRF